MEDKIISNLKCILKDYKKEYEKKRNLIQDLIYEREKEHSIKTYYIVTSDLGYSFTTYSLQTNASIDTIKLMDFKYGMKYRHQSTSISDITKGLIENGFTALITAKLANTKVENYDYMCSFGNY